MAIKVNRQVNVDPSAITNTFCIHTSTMWNSTQSLVGQRQQLMGLLTSFIGDEAHPTAGVFMLAVIKRAIFLIHSIISLIACS